MVQKKFGEMGNDTNFKCSALNVTIEKTLTQKLFYVINL